MKNELPTGSADLLCLAVLVNEQNLAGRLLLLSSQVHTAVGYRRRQGLSLAKLERSFLARAKINLFTRHLKKGVEDGYRVYWAYCFFTVGFSIKLTPSTALSACTSASLHSSLHS